MVEYNDLSDEDKVLLTVEWEGSVISPDVTLLLYNCSIAYASSLLREIYIRKLLKRKKERKKKGGFLYRYVLTKGGERRVAFLHENGY